MDNLSVADLERLTHSQLINLVKRGRLSVMSTMPLPLTSEMTTKYETHEYQAVAHLKGRPISISEAARKYDVPRVTIIQWVRRGLIQNIGRDRNRVLIDEADVAYCAEIRRQNPGAGRWLFNQDGTPYIPK